MTKTIAVTGASGHIGNVVCRTLLEKGFQVKAHYFSDKKSLEGLPLQLIKANILDEEELCKLVENTEIVIHCAAIISIHGDPTGIVYKTNTQGTENIYRAAQKAGVKKFIHISSTHAVTEKPLSKPFTEERPYKTVHDYAYDYSKATAELFLLNQTYTGMEIIILRPSSVLGPYDFKPSPLGKALLDFYHQKIPILPSGGYNFVDVRDVANSVVQAIEHGKNANIYLLTGQYYSMKELAQHIHLVTGVKTPKRVLPFWLLKSILPFIHLYSKLTGAAPLFTIESIVALKNGHPQMDHTKASRELNHQTRPIQATLTDFYSWQMKNKKDSR